MTYQRFAPVAPVEVAGAILRLTQARTRGVQMLRALEAIGVDPRTAAPLRYPLVKLVECDVVLLGNLARMRRERSARHLAALVPRLVEIAQDKRRLVQQAVPADRHHQLLHALAAGPVRDEDTLAEADRLALEYGPDTLGGTPLPLSEAQATHLAEHGWGTVLPWPWHLGTARS